MTKKEDSASQARIEQAMHELFIAVPQATLRAEDRKKSCEMVGFLSEIERVVAELKKTRPLLLVDAACGKAPVALLAARLVLLPRFARLSLVAIERDPRVAERASAAAHRVVPGLELDVRVGDVGDPVLWPAEPDLVVALHACGTAADAIFTRAAHAKARHLLVVPCCTSEAMPAVQQARLAAEHLGIVRQAEVRRRWIQSWVDNLRTSTLEAAGYHVEVAAFVPPTVTPHNLVWRARRVGEPARMRQARARLERMQSVSRAL